MAGDRSVERRRASLGWIRRFASAGWAGARSDTVSIIVSAVVVGALAGLAAVAFDEGVRATSEFVAAVRHDAGGIWTTFLTLAIPIVGGALITPVVVRWSPDVRGSGIPHVMVAVSNLGGWVPRRLLIWRPLATIASVGSGASLGVEGPVVQMGASLASSLSRWWSLDDERRRSLVAVAAAGGIAATFNAPIAGVLFALETILGRFEGRYFSSVVIGAVSATAVSRSVLGDVPAFAVPDGQVLGSALELPLYLLLGAIAAAGSVGFVRAMVLSEDAFNRLRISPWWRPTLGGAAIGVFALVMPEVLGRGYEITGAVLNEQVRAPALLAALIVMKTVATGTSLASWGSGGIMAPVLLIGASMGGLFGELAAWGLPSMDLRTGSYALVGMAALFAGVTRAPMSSIVMIFEMSGSYELILPLLFSAVIATLVAERMQPESYYEVMLTRRGLKLLRSRETDLLQTVTVREVMDADAPRIAASTTTTEVARRMRRSHHHGVLVVDDEDPERMVGIVTLSDLERAEAAGSDAATDVGSICTRRVHTIDPGAPASEALEAMDRWDVGRLPVADRSSPDRPIGIVRQADVARAYGMALRRERRREQLLETLRLRDLTGQEILEIVVPDGSPLAGVSLRDARLPQECIVVAVRRGLDVVFPHGDTILEVGDRVVVNAAPGYGAVVRRRFAEGDVAPFVRP